MIKFLLDENVPVAVGDFLRNMSFDEELPDKLRILAAINYGTIVDTMSSDPAFSDRCHKVFCKIAPEFITDPVG